MHVWQELIQNKDKREAEIFKWSENLWIQKGVSTIKDFITNICIFKFYDYFPFAVISAVIYSVLPASCQDSNTQGLVFLKKVRLMKME